MRCISAFLRTFRFFGANDSQIRKNDYASRLTEMEKNAHSVGLVQNLL
jgi:hypothetical protein